MTCNFPFILNSISVILGRWMGDGERLCIMKRRLRLKSSPPAAGLRFQTSLLKADGNFIIFLVSLYQHF